MSIIVEDAVKAIREHPANIEVFIAQITSVPIAEFDELAVVLVQRYVQIIPMLFSALPKGRKDQDLGSKLLLFWEKYTDELDDVVRTSQPFLLETVDDIIHLLQNVAACTDKELMRRVIMNVSMMFSSDKGAEILQKSSEHERTHIRIALRHISQKLHAETESDDIRLMLHKLDGILL